MSGEYERALALLNKRQLKAVKTIDGPLLVIAGPGTGKTQLVGTRVGYILKSTDTPADAILLLTFTEAGVQAMRERLDRLIGQAAYDVQLSTYHAFGGEIFRRYPDYFEGANLNLIDELSSDTLLRRIIAKLPYSNPLKFADSYIGDIKEFISDCKQALLDPSDIERVAVRNLRFIQESNKKCRGILDKLTPVSKKTVPLFEELAELLIMKDDETLPESVRPLASYAKADLDAALQSFEETSRTTQLTQWKRQWLAKDDRGKSVFDGRRANERLAAAAGIYRQYQQTLRKEMLYDYDDMILRAIDALETNRELKYSLAERYSYIMLDEFQDTNPAQFKLVQLLTDHPVHEGRPNIMAVGDDDQAIYAFQGAEHANMAVFADYYREVEVISLKENYRAWQELLDTGMNVAGQIQNRLHERFEGINKTIEAVRQDLPEPPLIATREFKSDVAQYAWIADEVKRLIKKGVPASEIAVLAPKHRYLVPLLPYLARQGIPIRYERRENILDEPLVHQLERMSHLVLALADGNETLADAIWPEVLSFEFWNIPVERIWRINWQSKQSHEPWTAILLNDETLGAVASLFLRLAAILPATTLEQQMDALIGLPGDTNKLNLPARSPVYEYYFDSGSSEAKPLQFVKLISDLSVLRSRLREWRRNYDRPVGLRAFVEFTEGHRAAGLNILNTSPYHEQAEAVNLLTAYGAKGREFRAVFVVAALDEVWGSASRNQGRRLSLPANLSHIRYQGASEDERLRLLYVAVTRARTRLYITSYRQDLAGKKYDRLKYLNTSQSEDSPALCGILPAKFSQIIEDNKSTLPAPAAASYWQSRHLPPLNAKLKQVMAPRLEGYQLSATHLNHFLDIVNAGPQSFFMDCLLAFPNAPTITSAFGTAIHNTLRSAGNILRRDGALPPEAQLLETFEAQLGRIELGGDEQANLAERGRASLHEWLKQAAGQLNKSDFFEYDFKNEGSLFNGARLTGKVDRLTIDEKSKQITILDYKTGQSYTRWQGGVIKLHKFRQQLFFYKLLLENSARFRKYRVTKGIIEFVEPDESGRINRLELDFGQTDDDVKRTALLIKAVWDSAQALRFPDTSGYQPTLSGIRKFEDDLAGK